MANYQVYCETESATIKGTGAPPDPIVCPNSGDHTVRAATLCIVDTANNENIDTIYEAGS